MEFRVQSDRRETCWFLESKDMKAGRDFKRSSGSLASLQVTSGTFQD